MGNATRSQRTRYLVSESEATRRIEAYEKFGRSSMAAAKHLGIHRRTMDKFLDRYAYEFKHHHVAAGELSQTKIIDLGIPKETKRYLLTCAQSETKVHRGFWSNLRAFADHIGAEIKVSRFSYNKETFAREQKPERKKRGQLEASWSPDIVPFANDEIERLAPTLVWAGHLQILPTAVDPLSGFDGFTGAASTVIPHPRVSMKPVPTPRSQPTKHLYSTGCCTLKNYIPAKAGQKAEFHHSFGALLVEVLPDGTWFARQIVANNQGTFSDFPYRVSRGNVTENAQVAAIHWGDVHVANIDPRIQEMFWGDGGVLDTLRPRNQLFHDLVDGESHNHHAQKDHHHQYRLYQEGRNDIRAEFEQARTFVDQYAHRDWCQSIVVWSNHDDFIRKHLQQTDYRRDPANAKFLLSLELAAYEAMDAGEEPSLFASALNSETAKVLTDDRGGILIEGIECGYHGHAGANGSRGSVQQFAKLGLKTSTGHSHAAYWIAGATSAGTCSKLELSYNKGPSGWSHTFTVIYRGGKRAQFTANADTGRWRA